MAESSWPTVAGSRAVNDDQWELMTTAAFPDGIIGAPTDTTVAFGDSTGRQVKIRANKLAQVAGGGWSSGTSDNTLSISANSSGSTRIDTVVLRRSRTTWAITATVVTGTPGAGAPALTRNAKGGSTGSWDIPLATVTVVNGAVTIASGDVTNCAWYVRGGGVATTSTNTYQPPAADYNLLWHTDTGNAWVPVSGAWRIQGVWRASSTLTGTAASVTISSIPTTLKTLRLIANARGDTAASLTDLRYRIGGDSSTNYSHVLRYNQNGTVGVSAAVSQTSAQFGYLPAASAAGVWVTNECCWGGWDQTGRALTTAAHGGSMESGTVYIINDSIGAYFGSSTRNSLTILPGAGNFISGSSFVLEGRE